MDQNELTYIKIPYPAGQDLHLKIVVPTCSLVIAPGIGNAWVTGRYSDPKAVVPLSITQSEASAQIIAVGAFAYRTPRKNLPDMRLSFGRLHPFSLSISAGDISDHFDFGGIPLASLDIQYGAGSQSIDFSYPNPRAMNRLKIAADGGPVQIENVANANAEEISLHGESASYQLNFGGKLAQNTNLHFGVAVARAAISLPLDTAIKVISGSSPASSRADDFSNLDHAYWNGPARDHKQPLLSVHYAASYGPLRVQYAAAV